MQTAKHSITAQIVRNKKWHIGAFVLHWYNSNGSIIYWLNGGACICKKYCDCLITLES